MPKGSAQSTRSQTLDRLSSVTADSIISPCQKTELVHFTVMINQELSLVLSVNSFAQGDQTVIRSEEKAVSFQRVGNQATSVEHVVSLSE